MNIIETESLCFGYDGENVLEDVSIGFPQGKMTFVLGANGAGKSTLFLTLNGIIRPGSGLVKFRGEPLGYDKRSLRKIREKIGLVFQDPDDQLFCPTVYEDVTFGAVNMGLDDSEVRQRAEAAMEITGISELRNKSIHALSCGQKKRAAIAGVLVMEPEVMILDEPTAGLDPAGAGGIMKAVDTIRRERDMTVIISTHDMDMTPVFAEYVCLLDRGRNIFCGAPGELFGNPCLLREHGLRLPRVSHLLEILNKRDGIGVDFGAATVAAARRELLKFLT